MPKNKLSPSHLAPVEADHKTWEKVYGDARGTKYSSLTGINKDNISNLKVAWEYRSSKKKSGHPGVQPADCRRGLIYSNGGWKLRRARCKNRPLNLEVYSLGWRTGF
jgi:hypothetical protein